MDKYRLEKGRPASLEGRLEKEIRVYDLLDKIGMDYWHTDHPGAKAYTMEDCKEIDGILHATVCKNLFLTNRQHTSYYLLMMPGDKAFKTKELSPQIGSSRLSFGDPEEMEELLDCTPGSASIFGLMNDVNNRVQLLVDRDVVAGKFVGAHPCVNTASLKMPTAQLFDLYLRAVHHSKIEVVLGEETYGNFIR